MNNLQKALLVIIIIFSVAYSSIGIERIWWYYNDATVLDKLNIEGADIEPVDEYFRYTLSIDGGKHVFISENMSWENMTKHGFIVDGELNKDEQFWRQVVKKHDFFYPHPHTYICSWEVYL